MKKKVFYVLMIIGIIAFSIIYNNNRKVKPEELAASVKTNTKIESYIPKESYKGRVFYEVFVRSFKDSNGDGVGDLRGLTEKLDYLSDLGIKGLWITPINESPSYHCYDITNYYGINPMYGTMEDFENLIREAHKRDMMVIMDLVLNHTSAYHPWFRAASNDRNSPYRNYYVWADKNTNLKEVSSIDTRPWIKLKAFRSDYYYAIFSGIMPDLNYDNPEVRQQAKNIAKYYLNIGIDGFRLDGAKHIYDKETDKNLAWWKEFSGFVKAENKNAVLVGEVWDKPEITAAYLTSLDTDFNFTAADDILSALSKNDLSNLSGKLKDIYNIYENYNHNYTDSPFLSNHDTPRIMTSVLDAENLTEDPTDKAKEAAAILLTLPGTPYVYYGDETGMKGTKPDEQIREPFIWDNVDRKQNTSWETSDNHPDNIALSVLKDKPNSIYNFYKTMIHLRNSSEVLKYGNYDKVEVKNTNIVAYKRMLGGKEIYVFINGNKTDKKENISLNKFNVLYSNKRNDKELNLNGELTLMSNEILIIEIK